MTPHATFPANATQRPLVSAFAQAYTLQTSQIFSGFGRIWCLELVITNLRNWAILIFLIFHQTSHNCFETTCRIHCFSCNFFDWSIFHFTQRMINALFAVLKYIFSRALTPPPPPPSNFIVSFKSHCTGHKLTTVHW